jgi:hypothetical protein
MFFAAAELLDQAPCLAGCAALRPDDDAVFTPAAAPYRERRHEVVGSETTARLSLARPDAADLRAET